MLKEELDFILEKGEGYFVEFKENMGTGITKINQLCTDNKIDIPEYIFNEFFTVIFKRELNDELNEGINEGINLLYNYILNNPSKRLNQIEKDINTPIKTLERWIKQLKEENKIEYIGSNKTGGYFVKVNEINQKNI